MEGPLGTQAPRAELFVLATPEEGVDGEGGELTGAEQPPGVLASVGMEGRGRQGPQSSHTAPPPSSQAAKAGPQTKQGEVSSASSREALF